MAFDINVVDKGISVALSLMVMYAVWELIKKGPGWFERMVKATENSTSAILENSRIIENTEGMHDEMNAKIESIMQDVEDLKDEIVQKGQVDEKILSIVQTLERKIDDLGKPTIHKGGEDHEY
jgi:hypothetical protein